MVARPSQVSHAVEEKPQAEGDRGIPPVTKNVKNGAPGNKRKAAQTVGRLKWFHSLFGEVVLLNNVKIVGDIVPGGSKMDYVIPWR